MEEAKPRPGFPGDRAQAAAEKLRALRERANQELDQHRQRLALVETELSLRVRQLAEEFGGRASGSDSQDDVAILREQLAADRTKHDKFIEQLAAARRQLDAIQAQPCVACHEAAQQFAEAQAELNCLREQLKTAQQQHEEDRARHDKFTEQVAAARQAIADLQTKSHEQSAALQIELETARAAKAAAEDSAAVAARDLAALQSEHNALKSRTEQLQRDSAKSLDEQRLATGAETEVLRQQITSLTSETEQLRQQLASQKSEAEPLRQQISALTAEVETDRQQAMARNAELEKNKSAHTAAEERAKSLEAELTDARKQRDALTRQVEEIERQKTDVEARLGSITASMEGEHKVTAERLAAVEAEKISLAKTLAEAVTEKDCFEHSFTEADAKRRDLEKSLEDARQQVAALQKSSGNDVAELRTNLEKAEAEAAKLTGARDELKTSLEQARAELAQLRESSRPKADLDNLQQKFDLALADVQKLKRESGELREELANRPAAGADVSPELVAVRTERDGLLVRVQELEKAAAAGSATSSQDVDDLHRRFEMAVDDVRQLKQENAQLREQLASAKTSCGVGPAPSSGGSDWAAQRARLMAMLEQEDGDGSLDAARRKQRATIEETIERTDRAIAEKEREIAELRATQEAYTTGASCTVDLQREEILSADEVVAAERERLAQLQSEWEDKLRKAELEFSVERAKLAREQAAVKERHFELQKAGALNEGGEAKPRRSWLTALGLGEESADGGKSK